MWQITITVLFIKIDSQTNYQFLIHISNKKFIHKIQIKSEYN